jgi:hypothetical protein
MVAQVMAQSGTRTLVLEKETEFHDRVRGEGLVPWGGAVAKQLGCYRLLCDSCAFEKRWLLGRQDLVGRVVLGFRLSSRPEVHRVYAELVGAGHPGLQPPYDAFWGACYAVVEDPNDIAVGLMSPFDPDRKAWPPEGWAP